MERLMRFTLAQIVWIFTAGVLLFWSDAIRFAPGLLRAVRDVFYGESYINLQQNP